jgi:hypothetical protein
MNKLKIQNYVDYCDLVRLVEEKSGKYINDWAFKYKNSLTTDDFYSGNFPMARWAKSVGYDWKILNDIRHPDGTIEKRTGEDLEIRKHMSKEYNEFLEKNPSYDPVIPAQSFWRYAISNIFHCDVTNESLQSFNPSELLAEIKDLDLGKDNFVKEILPFFIEILEENNLPEDIKVCLSW